MECFDYLPIKKVDDMLVSEIDGYSIDEIGLLKNDCLGIKELERIQNTRALVVKEYGNETTFLQIINEKLTDPKAYKPGGTHVPTGYLPAKIPHFPDPPKPPPQKSPAPPPRHAAREAEAGQGAPQKQERDKYTFS